MTPPLSWYLLATAMLICLIICISLIIIQIKSLRWYSTFKNDGILSTETRISLSHTYDRIQFSPVVDRQHCPDLTTSDDAKQVLQKVSRNK
eukprot:143746_1